jgi:glutamate synthase (NADPH/NADH) small chain
MEGSKQELYKQARAENWREELRKSMKPKERMAIPRVKMLEQDAHARRANFEEVNQGLTAQMAVQEARRCLDCAKPTCIEGCPVNINIPQFIKHVEAEEFNKAFLSLQEENSLPAICGRVCPQEVQCEAHCFYSQKLDKEPVAIGYLERFVADQQRMAKKNGADMKKVQRNPNKAAKVAVIGSGPAGLAAAGDLSKMGYQVTVFEALHEFGGVLKYGIPAFRLPKDIVDHEIKNLEKTGVRFEKNMIIGKTILFDELKDQGYQAIFIGSGAGLPNFMGIAGENLNGVMSSNEYLTRVNLMGAGKEGYDTPVVKGKNVAVIGGGNTAMDSVRTAKRMGAERAMIIYRRSFEEMPARIEEIHHAKEEGIEFFNLTNPVAYHGINGWVQKIQAQEMELGKPDASGRRKPIPVPGSDFYIVADMVIVSIGVSPNPLVTSSLPGIIFNEKKAILVNEDNMQTNLDGYYAGGDIVRGGATVILAMGDGKKAAQNIHQQLQGETVTANI